MRYSVNKRRVNELMSDSCDWPIGSWWNVLIRFLVRDESGVIRLETSEFDETCKDIICLHPETGEQKVIVFAARLIPEGYEKPLFLFQKTRKKC